MIKETDVGTGGKCEMDMTSHQVLPNPHSNNHNQPNDLEKSYVFVSGTDGLLDDAVGGVDAVESTQAAIVEDKQPEIVSQNEQVDATTGEVLKSVDKGVAGTGSVCNGDFPIEIDITKKHDSSEHAIQSFVTGYEEEPTHKSETLFESEAKPVEDPVAKNPSMAGAVVEEIGDQNQTGKVLSLAKLEESHPISEFDPAPAMNKESKVGALELASESAEDGEISNTSLCISSAGSADGANEGEINISSTKEVQENQESQVRTTDVVDCQSQDLGLVAKDGVKSAKEEMETAELEILPSPLLELVLEQNSINNNEEMNEEEAKITLSVDIQERPQLDTPPENNGQLVLEHGDETDTMLSSTDHHMGSVFDVVLEEKNEESFASLGGNDNQHVDEPEKLPNGEEIHPKTAHAESKTGASLLDESFPASYAHSPQTESETSDADAIETVSSLPMVGVTSQIIEDGFSDHDSRIRSITNETSARSGSKVDGVLAQNDSNGAVHTEDGEAPIEAEVSSGLSEVVDTQPAPTDVKLEMDVHVANYSAVSNCEGVDAVSVTCRMGDLDDSNAGNLTVSGSGSIADEVLLAQQQPNGVVHTEMEPTFQDGEAPAKAEAFGGLSEAADIQSTPTDLKLETEVHAVTYSAVSNAERMEAVAVTCTTGDLDSSNVENETNSGSDSTVDGVAQKEPNEVLIEKEPAFQDGEAPVEAKGYNGLCEAADTQSAITDVKLEMEVDADKYSTASNGRRMDPLPVICKTRDLDSSDVENESVANTLLEMEGVQHIGDQLDGAVGGGHETVLLQEDEAPGKSRAFDMTAEPAIHVPEASSNGRKTDDGSSTYITEVSDGFNVENGLAANNELEVQDMQNIRNQLDGVLAASHENICLQENGATEKPETIDFNPELRVSSAVDKSISAPGVCEAEVLDKVDVLNEGVVGDNHDIMISQGNEATGESGSSSSRVELEGSVANIIFREEPGASSNTKPFNFLVRVPRIDDDNLKEQIRLAKIHVDEKTKIRDAIQVQIQQKRASSQIHGIDYEFAKGEGRSARKLVKSKRMEIDSLQSTINKAKNALSIEDIDGQIKSLEHTIQHETVPLKDEKHFIREIKQLKQMREQLSSNLGSKDEIKHALEQRKEVEERLKILRKELDALKDQVVKAEASASEAGKRYDEESKKVRELQAEFRAADDVRQSAYAELLSLKKELSKKNEHFFKYKDAAAVGNNYAFSGNTEALYRLCTVNVSNFMELWNTDNEFRKDYVRCNARSTIRRLGTLDGRSLGPNEQPPILPSNADGRIGCKIPAPAKVDAASQLPIPEPKQETTVKPVVSDGKSMLKVTEHKNQKVSNKETVVPVIQNGYHHVSPQVPAGEVYEEPKKSAVEIELIRRAEELRRDESEAKLKEQRRLEALEKANEARERKKRRAEKLQTRAELRTQKEAELKEKEKEKRLRKKERKKAGPNYINDTNQQTETAPSSESAPGISKYSEAKEIPPATTKRAKKGWSFTKQSKSKTIPPPLRNRNKRKLLQQWMWVGFACFLILFLFWMGNVSLFSNGLPKRHDPVH